jgi:hypothetical protein
MLKFGALSRVTLIKIIMYSLNENAIIVTK